MKLWKTDPTYQKRDFVIWNDDEYERFLEAAWLYGNDNVKLMEHVKTKTL